MDEGSKVQAHSDSINLTPLNNLKWDEYKRQSFIESLSAKLNNNWVNFMGYCLEEKINDAVILLNSSIQLQECYLHRGARRFKTSPQPVWFNSDCEDSKRLKYEKLHNFHHSNSAPYLDQYIRARRNFREFCRLKKRAFNSMQAKTLIDNSLKSNSKDFWKQKKTHTSPNRQTNCRPTPKQWYDYFKNLLNALAEADNSVELNIGADINPVQLEGDMNNPITKEEIQNAIKKCKASGPDGIPSEFYTCTCKIGVFCDYLVTLFNSVFQSGIYPDEWTKSSIFALHKKGNVEDVNNYSGISLLNVLGKIFSHVLNSRLKLWTDANKLIPEAQGGFRSAYSTVDNIFVLQSMVQKYLGKEKESLRFVSVVGGRQTEHSTSRHRHFSVPNLNNASRPGSTSLPLSPLNKPIYKSKIYHNQDAIRQRSLNSPKHRPPIPIPRSDESNYVFTYCEVEENKNFFEETYNFLKESELCECGLRVVDSSLPLGWTIHKSDDPLTGKNIFFQHGEEHTSWEIPQQIVPLLTSQQVDFIVALCKKMGCKVPSCLANSSVMVQDRGNSRASRGSSQANSLVTRSSTTESQTSSNGSMSSAVDSTYETPSCLLLPSSPFYPSPASLASQSPSLPRVSEDPDSQTPEDVAGGEWASVSQYHPEQQYTDQSDVMSSSEGSFSASCHRRCSFNSIPAVTIQAVSGPPSVAPRTKSVRQS
ncbi:RNA-directed DNA polymerase from mobile element jockey [Elysia marginata]|uniref:RNA-directed DNA polymerase from mobile element jockey n=1 Tax=Elysia marginata TaxID=1093978 RepID=A0AAV4G624_9GAST|nr:RNA-directed DNA polymerase from mobile element jockey [Elysia marginata]